MSFDSGSPRPRGPLAWSIKTALIVGLGAMALGHHIAQPGGKPPYRGGDPEVTGSLGSKAQTTRLDPCTLRGALGTGARD
ncbi:hypothetical protein MKK50_24350 [Methylobacterium sp. J-043]|uniref:hypothetical protein n=1 Tax=Methylorubrum TaxID=2282523 RepID=UPI0020A1965E|nr:MULTISPECIES: hypothetical protein [Methylorubrum]MCJ2032503.1 hypothetical protein [Methylobacterium sp. J-043]MCP1549822.1 hypothetical protein [Methylorubrum zatmanii]MCP1553564.1 hypothetical protein [Methylorubrum extorquens]MCP1580124.1 hypothetical protein [Methylorubrum extorquens]